jgi:hypothetical protein
VGVPAGHGYQLGTPTSHRDPDGAPALAEVFVAQAARPAATAEQRGVDGYEVPQPELLLVALGRQAPHRRHRATHGNYLARELVAGDERVLCAGQVTVGDMDVGTAYAASPYRHHYFPGPRCWVGLLADADVPGALYHHCLHLLSFQLGVRGAHSRVLDCAEATSRRWQQHANSLQGAERQPAH